MKATLAIAMLATAALLAGCGSGSKLGSLSFKVGTTTTVKGVKTGTLIRCRGIETANVPPTGQQVAFSPSLPGSWARFACDT